MHLRPSDCMRLFQRVFMTPSENDTISPTSDDNVDHDLEIEDVDITDFGFDVADRPAHFGRSPVAMKITKAALTTLLESVGSKPPETGAALFGPVNGMGVDVVEFDVEGSSRAAGSIYSPDVEWGNARLQHWMYQSAEARRLFTGHCHSHPMGFGWPSGKAGPAMGDLGYTEAVFAMNEVMEVFLIPILTGTDGHGPQLIWPWVTTRDDPLTPLWADLEICEVDAFDQRPFNPEWEAQVARRLVVVSNESPREPETVIDEPPPAHPLVSREAYFARTEGQLSEAFHARRIVAVGCGAGSFLIEKLARLGPAELILVDPDVVETPNLTRTNFEVTDLGRPKVEALAERISHVAPHTGATYHQARIEQLDADGLLDGVDLVIAGTDSVEAQRHCNTIAMARNIPALFIGIHKGALGGRLIFSVPGQTACYRCAAPDRYEDLTATDGVNGAPVHDLHGEVGLLPNTLFVDAIALQLAVAILERGQDTPFGGWLKSLGPRSEIMVRCDPAYDHGRRMFDVMLGDLPTEPKPYADELKAQAFFASDTLWLETKLNPACQDCGWAQKRAREEGAA